MIVEHDPMLYKDAAEMLDYVSCAMSDTAKESAMLLYSPGSDPFLEVLARNANRLLYFDEGPKATGEVFEALKITQIDNSEYSSQLLLVCVI
jgi:hypothetical protein